MNAPTVLVAALATCAFAGCVAEAGLAPTPSPTDLVEPASTCAAPTTGAGYIVHVSINGTNASAPMGGALLVRTIDASGNYTHYDIDNGTCAVIPTLGRSNVSIEVELGCSAYQHGAIIDYSRFAHANPPVRDAGWTHLNMTLDRGCDMPSDDFR